MIDLQHLFSEEIQSYCTHCQRAFPQGKWFARLWRHDRPLEFCRPRCLELFLGGGDRDALEDRYVPIKLYQPEIDNLSPLKPPAVAPRNESVAGAWPVSAG